MSPVAPGECQSSVAATVAMIVFNIFWTTSRVAEIRKKANEASVIIEREEGSLYIVCSNNQV